MSKHSKSGWWIPWLNVHPGITALVHIFNLNLSAGPPPKAPKKEHPNPLHGRPGAKMWKRHNRNLYQRHDL